MRNDIEQGGRPQLDEAAKGKARRLYGVLNDTIAAENAARAEGRQWSALANLSLPEGATSEKAATLHKRLKETSLYTDNRPQRGSLSEIKLSETGARKARGLNQGLQEIAEKFPLPLPAPEYEKVFEEVTAQRYQAENELFAEISEEFGSSTQP